MLCRKARQLGRLFPIKSPHGEPPERSHLGARAACSGSLSSAAFGCFGRTSMRSTTVKPAASIQRAAPPARRSPRCSARSERISQPSPPGSRCAGSPLEEPAQHAALGIVDAVLQRRARRARESTADCTPRARRVPAERDPPARLPPVSPARGARGSRARTPARADRVRGDHAPDAAAREHCGQHARPGADVEGHAGASDAGAAAPCDEVDVLAANRREHAVVRMDSPAGRRDLDSLRAPLVRADDAEQLSQRDDRRLLSPARRPPRRPAGCPARAATESRSRPRAGSAACQRAGALRPGLAIEMEGFGRRGGHRGAAAFFGLRDGRSTRFASASNI